MKKSLKKDLLTLSLALILATTSYAAITNAAVMPEKEYQNTKKKQVYINNKK